MPTQQIGKTKISFHFRPVEKALNDRVKGFSVEKDEGGVKRRYLCGVSSGIELDGHNEKMSPKAIESFITQAQSGDVLLYADIHGIKSSEDIGIMTKAEILENGDWYTEYRLYDLADGMPQSTLDTVEVLWKQLNGLPPYTKARQKGFSIEGSIPNGAVRVTKMDPHGKAIEREIDEVELDGVVLVPKPAYTSSVALACYKALGELPPTVGERIYKDFQSELSTINEKDNASDEFYDKKWEYQEALESAIDKIMRRKNDSLKEQRLSQVFDSYKDYMIPLIMQSEVLFQNDDIEDAVLNVIGNTQADQSVQTGQEQISESDGDLAKSLLIVNKALALVARNVKSRSNKK